MAIKIYKVRRTGDDQVTLWAGRCSIQEINLVQSLLLGSQLEIEVEQPDGERAGFTFFNLRRLDGSTLDVLRVFERLRRDQHVQIERITASLIDSNRLLNVLTNDNRAHLFVVRYGNKFVCHESENGIPQSETGSTDAKEPFPRQSQFTVESDRRGVVNKLRDFGIMDDEANYWIDQLQDSIAN